MYGGLKVDSGEVPSFWQRCRGALPRLSERQAKVLGVGSQILQHAAAGFLSYEAAKVYNDPYRGAEERLGSSFYVPLAGALGMMTAATGIAIFNRMRKKKVVRGVADPVMLAGSCALGAVIASGLAERVAQKLYDQVVAYNNAENQEYIDESNRLQALINACKSTLFENRTEFTVPECAICDSSSTTWGKWGEQFWQASYEIGLSQIVCYDQLPPNLQPMWDDLVSISANASNGVWPCFGEVLYNPEYNTLLMIDHLFGVGTPFTFVVQSLNASCKVMKGEGTRLFFPMHWICEVDFSSTLTNNFCATPALDEFGHNYTQFYFNPAEPFQKGYPGQVERMIEKDGVVLQNVLFGSVLGLSVCVTIVNHLCCITTYEKEEAKGLL